MISLGREIDADISAVHSTFNNHQSGRSLHGFKVCFDLPGLWFFFLSDFSDMPRAIDPQTKLFRLFLPFPRIVTLAFSPPFSHYCVFPHNFPGQSTVSPLGRINSCTFAHLFGKPQSCVSPPFTLPCVPWLNFPLCMATQNCLLHPFYASVLFKTQVLL